MLIGTWKVKARLKRFQWKMRVLFRISSVGAKNLDALLSIPETSWETGWLTQQRAAHHLDGNKGITHRLGLMYRARTWRSREVRF